MTLSRMDEEESPLKLSDFAVSEAVEVSGVVTAAVPVPPAVQQCLYAAGRGGDREAL